MASIAAAPAPTFNPLANPRVALWVLGGLLLLGAGASYVVLRAYQRQQATPYGGVLVSCASHRGEELCVWHVPDEGYTYSVGGGAAVRERYGDPTLAAAAGRLFIETLSAKAA